MVDAVFNIPPSHEPSPHAWLVVGDMVISVTQEGSVPEAQWPLFISDLANPKTKRVLGLAVGSIHITSRQRRSAVIAMRDKRVAAVVGSSVARGIATALSWMGLQLRAYSWASLTDALIYLDPPGLTPEEGVELIERLLHQAGAPPLDDLV